MSNENSLINNDLENKNENEKEELNKKPSDDDNNKDVINQEYKNKDNAPNDDINDEKSNAEKSNNENEKNGIINDTDVIENNNIEENKDIDKNDEVNSITEKRDNNDNDINVNNNSENFLENSNNLDDDILQKIDDEANKFENKNVISGNDIYDKYDKVTENQFRELFQEKNKKLLSLSEIQENFKKELSNIIDKLNEAFEKSNNMITFEKNPLQNKILENKIHIKSKELSNVKSQVVHYKKQNDIVAAKANDKFSSERINEMEENIANRRKENYDLSMHLKKLKTKQNTKGRELQTNNIMKKYPNQINSLTDEIKNIMGKKQDFLTKITNNKKSLNNLRTILSTLEKNYNQMIQSKSFQKTVDNLTIIRIIDESVKNYKKDLELTEEELLDKINKQETSIKFSLSNRIISSPKMTRARVLGIESPSLAKKNLYAKLNNNSINSLKNLKENDANNYYQNQSQNQKKNDKLMLPKILSNNHYEKNKKNQSPYKGIFNKYESLKKDKNSNTLNIQNGGKKIYGIDIRTKNMIINNKNKKDQDRSNDDLLDNSREDEEINLNLDYEATLNSDYINLQKKERQLERVNRKMDKNHRETEKLYEKKFKDIQNTIEHNQKKLKIMQQQNELIAVEISDLTHILKLNVEEKKLKKEIKDNESKILKSVILNTNDVSQTRNDILIELNKLDDDIIKKNKKDIKENIIKEENGETNNSLIINEEDDMEDNKPIKFPDISNVEHINDDTINPSRINKLNSIKNKYLTDNENINHNDDNMENDDINPDENSPDIIFDTENNQ